jgi:hypothetical protein
VAKVKVYRFTVYDITADEQHRSRRWGTREAIDRARGEVLEDTATEVDESVLGREIDGMTDRDLIRIRAPAFSNK